MNEREPPARWNPPEPVGHVRPDDLRRSERSMIIVRWAAVPFAVLQVLVYDDLPFPDNIPVFELALAATGLLALGNGVAQLLVGRITDLGRLRLLSLATLALDGAVALSFVWLWTFDQESALWAVLFIMPLEGAIKFQLVGALGTWVGVTALYTAREFWGEATYPAFDLQWNSITFRMGIGLLIALVAGFMARNLTRQRGLVEATLARLRKVDRVRSTLVSTLAHDVRSPITAIRGALRTVLRHGNRLETPVSRDLLAGADRQAARLERLASDLLDLARLERGRLELALEEVLLRDSIVQSVSYLEQGDRFDLRVEPDLVIRADPGRLEQIVVNLASNALRHGEAPYVIEGTKEGNRIAVSFVDHGPGVPPAALEALFEPFRAEDGETSVGFGLAIVKALAQAHGGDVEYRDNQPRGARFTVTLPLAESRSEEPQPAT